jgi:hypothetical protein
MEGGKITTAVGGHNPSKKTRKSDAPRSKDGLKVPWAGYVVSYLQASKERGVGRRLGKGFA